MFSKQILSSLIETCESDITLVKELIGNCVTASVTDVMTVILTKLGKFILRNQPKANYEHLKKELMELKEEIRSFLEILNNINLSQFKLKIEKF